MPSARRLVAVTASTVIAILLVSLLAFVASRADDLIDHQK